MQLYQEHLFISFLSVREERASSYRWHQINSSNKLTSHFACSSFTFKASFHPSSHRFQSAAIDDQGLCEHSCRLRTETAAVSPAGCLCAGRSASTNPPSQDSWVSGPAYFKTHTHYKHMINSCSCRDNEVSLVHCIDHLIDHIKHIHEQTYVLMQETCTHTLHPLTPLNLSFTTVKLKD